MSKKKTTPPENLNDLKSYEGLRQAQIRMAETFNDPTIVRRMNPLNVAADEYSVKLMKQKLKDLITAETEKEKPRLPG